MSLPSVLAAKEAVNRAFETSLAEGVRFERRVFHSLFATGTRRKAWWPSSKSGRRNSSTDSPARAVRTYYIADMLTDDELERYARHIVLRDVGGPGQAALGRARCWSIGAGGLGAPVLLYLAAAGVGTLGVVDDDVVALSNLQRQVIHTTPDIGVPKVDSAAAMIQRLNPHVAVKQYNTRLTAKNALELIGGYDIVADGSDNFATRYLVVGRLLFRQEAAGHGGARHVRRHADHDPRP